jgi:hypothetical protein
MSSYLEKTPSKKRTGGMAQGVDLGFKPQCRNEKIITPKQSLSALFIILSLLVYSSGRC